MQADERTKDELYYIGALTAIARQPQGISKVFTGRLRFSWLLPRV